MFRSEFEPSYDDSEHEERQPTVDREEWSRQTIRTTESWHGKPHKMRATLTNINAGIEAVLPEKIELEKAIDSLSQKLRSDKEDQQKFMDENRSFLVQLPEDLAAAAKQLGNMEQKLTQSFAAVKTDQENAVNGCRPESDFLTTISLLSSRLAPYVSLPR